MSDILKSVIELFPTRPKTVIPMSGSGTNAVALLRDQRVRDLYDIALIFTDNPKSNAASIAAAHNIPLLGLHAGRISSKQERAAYFELVLREMGRSGIQAAVYAGFMKIVSPAFCEELPGVNIHPADLRITDPVTRLPEYTGMAALSRMRDDLEHVASTIHVVDEQVDSGAIIAVSSYVPCQSGWSDEQCHDQLKLYEHQFYPAVLAILAAGGLSPGDLPLAVVTEA